MSKYAVITLAIGYQRFWKRTHAIMRNYADKIGADFIKITERKIPHSLEFTTGYNLEKFQIYNYLSIYDRIIFFDGDIVIHPQCPNLFELVPENRLGVVCENAPCYDRSFTFQKACDFYGAKYPGNSEDWFNGGMMVVSQPQRKLFIQPEKIRDFPAEQADGTISHNFVWLDTPMLNAWRIVKNIEIKNLGFRFNYVGSLKSLTNKPFEPEEAFIFHGSGFEKPYIYKIIKSWYGALSPFQEIESLAAQER